MKVPVPGAVGRYARTVRHLRPAQLGHRMKLRTQQRVVALFPGGFEARWRLPLAAAPRWSAEFEAIDLQTPPPQLCLADLRRGNFTFLGTTRHLGDPIDWAPAGASQLWLYHLHYWEWVWALLAHPDREEAATVFGHLWKSWTSRTRFGQVNVWSPYPTSLRSWVFVNAFEPLVRGTSIETAFVDDLRLHAGFVRHNLELDVGGNHLVKNLKAAHALGLFLGDDGLVELAHRHLRRQVAIQVLPDGGHYERSPSYHAQVLGDLIDITRSHQVARGADLADLDGAVTSMRSWLEPMVMPDGDLPVFNDGERVGPSRIRALGVQPLSVAGLTVLGDSGYVVARGERVHLVADVGEACPPDLPAHAQADCLSFELAVDGQRVIVDPGTSEYGSGPQRQFERCTGAHNTITVDGEDQTEVWGAFRAGRLAHATLVRAGERTEGAEIVGTHDGYLHLVGHPAHERTWEVSPRRVTVTDHISGHGRHHLTLRLLIPDHRVRAVTSTAVHCDGCRVDAPRLISPEPTSVQPDVTVREDTFATGFGEVRRCRAMTVSVVAPLPVTMKTVIELVG